MDTINDHIKFNKVQLGSELSHKKLIYLDLNYWINLRKCLTNNKVDGVYYEFYNLLLSLVQTNKVLCPINHTVFSELLKQDNLESRINTAKVIDLFSDSVTLIFPFEREEYELQYYIRQKLLKEITLTPIEQYVWVKIPYIMGIQIPYYDGIDEEVQREIQIKFFNYLWTINLEDMMRNYIKDSFRHILDKSQAASNLNVGKFSHSHEIISLDQLFKMEVRGGLSVYTEVVQSYFNWLSKNRPNILTLLNSNFSINNSSDFCNKIEDDFLKDKIDTYLPDLYINTCIHTLMRWDKSRIFKANDLYDFEHARAALPYYQYFFTERPLKHMLTMKPYALAKKYHCVVENDIKKVNELLHKMAS